jgi:hypothetical protein
MILSVMADYAETEAGAQPWAEAKLAWCGGVLSFRDEDVGL